MYVHEAAVGGLFGTLSESCASHNTLAVSAPSTRASRDDASRRSYGGANVHLVEADAEGLGRNLSHLGVLQHRTTYLLTRVREAGMSEVSLTSPWPISTPPWLTSTVPSV